MPLHDTPFVVVNIMELTRSCFISVWSEGIGGDKGGTLSSEKLLSGKLPASEGSGSVGWASSSALQMVTGGCLSVPESDGGVLFSSIVVPLQMHAIHSIYHLHGKL